MQTALLLSAALSQLLRQNTPVILVMIQQAHGSTPRDAGTTMLVTAEASLGTIGGGALEFHAQDVARTMMATRECYRQLAVPLGPQIGQCCGGHVTLTLEQASDQTVLMLEKSEHQQQADAPAVLVFGAGHIGIALYRAMAPLPFTLRLIDDRPAELADIPALEIRDDPATAILTAPARSAFIILTHSHALDYRLTQAALMRSDAAYVGMIGSLTKRRLFERWYIQQGGVRTRLEDLTCPIGGDTIRDKRPEVIAALVASEMLHCFFRAAPSASPIR